MVSSTAIRVTAYLLTTAYPFGGNDFTGAIPAYPSSPASFAGNFPCQVLVIHFPPSRNSSPQTYVFPDNPPRGANSNSASEARDRLRQIGWCFPQRLAVPPGRSWRDLRAGTNTLGKITATRRAILHMSILRMPRHQLTYRARDTLGKDKDRDHQREQKKHCVHRDAH